MNLVLERNLNGGSSIKKKRKPKKTKKAKDVKLRKGSVPKHKNFKKTCKTECDKTNKILPIMLKKMGLSQRRNRYQIKRTQRYM